MIHIVRKGPALFADHYLLDEVICHFHSGRADAAQVADSLFDILVNDAVSLAGMDAVESQNSGLDGTRYA